MSRLLAISWEMPPLSGPRAVQVARLLRQLAHHDWHSTVVCFGPRSDRYNQDYAIDVQRESGGAVELVRVPSPEEWFVFRALWRVCPPVKRLPDEKRVWVARAAEAAHAAVCRRSHDVVISFGQPWSDHLIARRLVRRIAMPWVAHFSDPWVGSPYTRGGAWQRRLNEQMERDVVSTATRIVFQNAETAEYTMSRYPAEWRAKTAVIPQGFDPTVTAGPRPSDVSRTRPLSVVYTGRFYPGVRTPDTLLEAVGRLHARERLDARLHVDFFGHPWAPYARRAHTLGIDSVVTFHGRIAPPEAQAAAARADVLLIIDAPSAGPNLFLPSKAVDYLPLRRPMLAITPTVGATAALMNRLRYPVVDPDDIAGMEQALRELIAEHEAGTLAASMTHDEVAREYDIREIAGRFDALLRGIVPSAAARRPPLVGVS